VNRNDKYLALVRRELWEHRSLWIWPVAITVVLVAATLCVAIFAGGKLHVHGTWGDANIRLPNGATAMAVGVYGLAAQVIGITAIVCFLYLVDCLYAERKDRSILFWKSLPVSDTATVLAKFGVALLVIPLLAYGLISVAYPIIYGFAGIGVSGFEQATGGWNSLDWLRAEGTLLLSLLVSLLWYAPIAAWAMLASVVATRAPVMFAVLPVLVAVCENIVLRTHYVWSFLGRRLAPVSAWQEGIQRPDLWLGLVVAAVLLYAVIRLRRYRDDT
jgi:ABC-2 type transport system permease protein